jgi:DNA-binding beta-propeller fold protein YncE
MRIVPRGPGVQTPSSAAVMTRSGCTRKTARVRSLLAGISAIALAGCGGGGAGGAHTDRPSDPPAAAGASAGSSHAAHATSDHLRATLVGRLPAPVQDPATTAYGRGALLAGGLDARDVSVADLVRVGDGRARRVGRLPAALHDAAATTIGGTPYVVGGGDAGSSISAIERIGSAGAVTRTGALPVGASDVSAASIGRMGYVVGGYTGRVPLRSILRFGSGGPVRDVGTLPRPLRYAAVAAADGRLIIAGGTSGVTAQRDVLRFDPATRRVTRIGRLPAPLTHAAAATLGGTVYVIGGRGEALTAQHAQILAIDPRSGRTHVAGHLPTALSDTGAAAVGTRILVAGGRDAGGRVHDELLALTPSDGGAQQPASAHATPRAQAAPRARAASMPRLLDAHNAYAAAGLHGLSSSARHDPPRVYVPNSGSDTVDVIDQKTFRIVDHFATGALPQHVTPSWDLRTLWVDNDRGNSLTPINPRTGHHGTPVHVDDPYNLYFTPDGQRAIVVAEALHRLDFREPHTMRLKHSVTVDCRGVDHMDMTLDGRQALVSCEFSGEMLRLDLVHERVLGKIALRSGAMPQDVKLAPDGRVFYVADMGSGGVWVIDAHRFRKLRFIPTGRQAHGLYPSRDARRMFISNRGEGSISVLSFRTGHVVRTWHLPGGGSPDMGGVSADGRILWLSGRYNAEVYAISTRTGHVLHRIRVGSGPHGMCVWPQPGRYSLGHTGVLR